MKFPHDTYWVMFDRGFRIWWRPKYWHLGFSREIWDMGPFTIYW